MTEIIMPPDTKEIDELLAQEIDDLVDNEKEIDYMSYLFDIIENDTNETTIKYKIYNHKDMEDHYITRNARVFNIKMNKIVSVLYYVIDEPVQEYIIIIYNNNIIKRGFLYSEHVKHYYEEFEYELFSMETLNTYELIDTYATMETIEGYDYDTIETFDFCVREIEEF